ncbi:hypothetical protein Tco_0419613, partial [Tanacetum coccineum]
SMAEDAVNAAIKSGKLNPANSSLTSNLRLVGGDGWDPAFSPCWLKNTYT